MTLANSDPPRRYLAAWLPYLPADRVLRQRRGASSALRDDPKARKAKPPSPLVIVEKVKGAQRLAAVSRSAQKLGLAPGLTLADAQARILDLDVVEADTAADAALLEQLADDCDRFTPIVMIDAPDGLLLDITGVSYLFGGEGALRSILIGRVRRIGLHVRAAIAGAPDTARALARFSSLDIAAPGSEAEAVRPLPISALAIADEVTLALNRAGLKTIGDLAERPSQPLSARFRDGFIRQLNRTLGYEIGPLTPRRQVPVVSAERRFAEPIARAEDIEASLRELACETGETLHQRREGGRVFEASFFRADGAVRRIAVETGRPSRESRALLRLFRERLETLADPIDPGFGFDLIRLSVPVVEPLAPAQSNLDGRVIEEDEVANLIDRLAARFGRDRVVRLEAVDTHDPDRAAHAMPAVESIDSQAQWPSLEAEAPPARPTHLFEPPQPIIATAEVPDGPPRSFTWRKAKHDVVFAEGPERIAPEWWRKTGARTRDYYRVEDVDGRRFWIFRAGLYDRAGEPPPGWYVHGLFA